MNFRSSSKVDKSMGNLTRIDEEDENIGLRSKEKHFLLRTFSSYEKKSKNVLRRLNLFKRSGSLSPGYLSPNNVTNPTTNEEEIILGPFNTTARYRSYPR